MKEIYVSIDIEADGPIPGEYSMLSLGAAAFDVTSKNPRKPISTFEVNILPLPDAKQDPDTMQFWARNKEAWNYVTSNQVGAAAAMRDFKVWVEKLPGNPVLIGYPVTFDFMFVYWYYVKMIGSRPVFGFQGLDIKTLAMDKLSLHYRGTTKKRFPKHWSDGAPRHTHKALDDAIGQGIILVNMLNPHQQ